MRSDFMAMLGELRDGTLLSELDERLKDVTRRVDETGKKGTLTLTLEINSAARGKVEITAKAADKTPDPKHESNQFYLTDGGSLSRRNPAQPELPNLRTLPGGIE